MNLFLQPESLHLPLTTATPSSCLHVNTDDATASFQTQATVTSLYVEPHPAHYLYFEKKTCYSLKCFISEFEDLDYFITFRKKACVHFAMWYLLRIINFIHTPVSFHIISFPPFFLVSPGISLICVTVAFSISSDLLQFTVKKIHIRWVFLCVFFLFFFFSNNETLVP